ncbi:hypothetical protein ACLB1G_04515 [Oxalobacteraceae bacterium A2-2]
MTARPLPAAPPLVAAPANRHYRLLDAAARDTWMACIAQALAEQVADATLRAQLHAAFFITADTLRNR